jgi:hypothetical protein
MATLILPLVLWTTLLAGVVMIDLSAYLVAAARAQQVADAAALAAVSDSGFSQKICLPAAAARSTRSSCVECGVVRMTASTFGSSSAC